MTTDFGNELCFSRPRHDNKTSAEAFGVSIFFHIAIVIGVAWLSLAPRDVAQSENQHTIIPVFEEEKAQQPLPAPPPPPSNRVYQQQTDAPRGFQTLTVPTYITPEIPPPAVGPDLDEADFSGEGVEGGRGRGRVDPNADKIVTGEDISAAPAFTPYTVAPELRNREEIAKLLVEWYPRLLRDAGIGGRVMTWVFIDEKGQVRNTRVRKGSDLPELDSAAVRVTRRMHFRPAQNRDVKVPVWVELPIIFKVEQ
jgi:periplasmic protein TonB